MKICRENPNLGKISQKYLTLYFVPRIYIDYLVLSNTNAVNLVDSAPFRPTEPSPVH